PCANRSTAENYHRAVSYQRSASWRNNSGSAPLRSAAPCVSWNVKVLSTISRISGPLSDRPILGQKTRIQPESPSWERTSEAHWRLELLEELSKLANVVVGACRSMMLS